jgi:DNA polymerase I-like protein with 3'-5' exonuclease and polymerase domains
MLGAVYGKVLHLKTLSEPHQDKRAPTTRTFDLVNCGPNHRFQTSTGLIAHNCLGLSYGMGAKKAVKTLYEQGFILSQADAKKFHTSYWQLFSGVKRLADRLGRIAEEDGYIVNPFGYRLIVSPFKAFNGFIQSSVSGALHVFSAKLMAAAPYARWITCIHDELLVDIPADMVDQFRKDAQAATDSLNEDLRWTVAIRTGFAVGRNWHEAK